MPASMAAALVEKSMEETITALRAVDIWKQYPGGVVANKGVSLEVRRGEILALLGENGAGKTTLVSIMAGLLEPDRGRVEVYGEPLKPGSLKDAVARGVVLVPQHPRLIESYTVEENIGLFLWSMGLGVPKPRLRKLLEQLIDETGLRVPLGEKVWRLSFGERQRAELLKALAAKPRILLLDEVTTHLSPVEFEELAGLTRKLARQGTSIVFITHKLREALAIADRIAVMRRGELVAVLSAAKTSKEQLLRLMFDTPATGIRQGTATGHGSGLGEELLVVHDVYVRDEHRRIVVKGVSLKLREGEVLGIAGVAGNGQRELFETIIGLRRPIRGRILVRGVDVTRKGPWARIRLGAAIVPEERLGWALVPGKDLVFNTMFPLLGSNGSRLLVDREKWEKETRKIIEMYRVKARSPRSLVDELSGGNMQKLVLGRELGLRKPKLVLAMNPTAGLDAKTASSVLSTLLQAAGRGAGVLLFSEDLDELLETATRIIVLSRGRVAGVFTPPYDVQEIGRAMTS